MTSKLDLRVCMFFIILTSMIAVILESELALLDMFLLLGIWLLLLGFPKKLIRHCIWYFILWGSIYYIQKIPVLGTTALPLITVYIRRLMLPIMAATPLVGDGESNGRLIATMNHMKLPKAGVLSLAILLRFLPTIAEEYRQIRNAQKFRGIGISFWNVISHPWKMIEYTMIPMLIRTSKTADELSASVSVRGMRLEGNVNPYYPVSMKWYDWLAILIGTILTLIIFLYDRLLIGDII